MAAVLPLLAGVAATAGLVLAYKALKAATQSADADFPCGDVKDPVKGCVGKPSPTAIANAVNPKESNINCGHIVDAVIARLKGTDPDAVAPAEQDGSFDAIGARHGTEVKWGKTFEQAFDEVNSGPEGTTAIVGILYGGGTASHVVVMTKQDGKATIIEAQDWGAGNPREAITTPERANERYNADGKSNVGVGVLP